MSTLTLRVPDDLDKALERQSAALGISKNDLAREALKRYLRVAEFRSCAPSWLRVRRPAGSIPMRMFSKHLRRSEDRARLFGTHSGTHQPCRRVRGTA